MEHGKAAGKQNNILGGMWEGLALEQASSKPQIGCENQ
jgi:hypothetical protein